MEGRHNRVLGQVVVVITLLLHTRGLNLTLLNFEEFYSFKVDFRVTNKCLGTRSNIIEDGNSQLRVSENLDLLFLLCDGSSLSNDKGGIGECGRGDA